MCDRLSYDWNDTDSFKIKEHTMKIVQEHFKLYHPTPPVEATEPPEKVIV